MAFTAGIHVEAGFAGVRGVQDTVQSLLSKRIWSETLALAGTSTHAAPSPGASSGQVIFRITSAVDAFVAIGAAPDASTGTRILIKAGERIDEPCEPGDKVAWIAA